MKLLKYLIVVTVFAFLFGCSETPALKPKGLTLTIESGDRQATIAIVSDTNVWKTDINNDPAIKRSVDFWGASIYVAKQQLIDDLVQYSKRKCSDILPTEKELLPNLIVRIFTYDNTERCFYYDAETTVEYYRGMVELVDRQPYSKECEELLSHLELIIKNEKIQVK